MTAKDKDVEPEASPILSPQAIITNLSRSGAAASDRKGWADLFRAVLPPGTDWSRPGLEPFGALRALHEPAPHECQAMGALLRTRRGRDRQPTATGRQS